MAAVGHQETFHFHVSSRVCPFTPFFIGCHDPFLDRQLPDYDQHREPITRPPVFISIIHREVSPVSMHTTFASRTFFLKLAAPNRSCNQTAPGTYSMDLHNSRNSVNLNAIPRNAFQRTLLPASLLPLPQSSRRLFVNF